MKISKQQARQLRALPLSVVDVRSKDGNQIRTIVSLVNRKLAEWTGPQDDEGRFYEEFAELIITEDGKNALAEYNKYSMP